MWIFKIYALTNFIAFIIGVFKYRFLTKDLRWVFYFVSLGVLTETYTRFHTHYIVKNTMPIGHFYFPIAFVLLGLFYLKLLKDFINPKYTLAVIITFLIYCVINSVFIQNIFEYPSIEGSIGSMIVFILAIVYFIKVMIDAKIDNLSKEPTIWINTALLIYFAGNFFFYILYNVRLTASREVAILAAKVFAALNLLFYLLISIGFLKVRKHSLHIKNK